MYYNYAVKPKSLYIHWPFCPYKCHFCSFVAIAAHDEYMERYHYALCREIEVFFKQYDQSLLIETVFIGGGTPSTYPDKLLLDMSGKLKKAVTYHPAVEVTIEVNPGTLREEQLEVWKNAGITRISIGVQSLNDVVLKKLNRHQSSHDVQTALIMASKQFDAISIDLIIGLPGISAVEWKQLLEQVVSWPINHISIYFLMVHENTPLYFGVKANKINLPCDDEIVELYYWSIDYLAQYGFVHYEISNFAREGYRSKHNMTYWQRNPFKGFGLGACSFDGASRLANEKNLIKYLEGVERDDSITIFSETLTREQIILEKMMLGLRQRQGFLLADVMNDMTESEKISLQHKIDNLVMRNLIIQQNNYLQLTPAALAVENEVIVQLSL